MKMLKSRIVLSACMAGLLVVGTGCETPLASDDASAVGFSLADVKNKAVARQREMIEGYVARKDFGKRLPVLAGGELERMLPKEMTSSQRNQVEREVVAEFNRCKTQIVYPAWIKFLTGRLEADVMVKVGAAQKNAATNGFAQARAVFEQAREVLWNVSGDAMLDGNPVPEVNGPVQSFAVDLLVGKVNVAHWAIAERELNAIADDSIANARPEDGMKALAEYPWVRAYTQRLDGRVDAITAELSRQGVPSPATEAISLATHNFMCEAAKLADRVDEVRHDRKLLKNGRPAPDDTRFKKLLDEYRKTLLRYGCTKKNTLVLTDWISKKAADLYEDLPKATENTYGSVTTTIRLGTTALNRRIDRLKGQLSAKLEDEVAKNEKIRHELEEMALKDPRAARERVIAMLTGAVQVGEAERALAKYELLTKINPEMWNAIATEISAKVEECARDGKCSEGIAWIQAYPRVRTYPEEIDSQYKAVCAAAIDMGVPQARASEIIDKIAAMTAEVDYLANYEDYEKPGRKPGVRISDDKVAAYEQAVGRSRSVLVRNGCTVENAECIIRSIHVAFSNETQKIESPIDRPVLYLGANAINVRLEAFKKNAALALISRYTEARLAANDVEGVRRTLRTVALTGDEDFDAEVYAIRLGAINALVNPYALEALKPQIETKVSDFCRKEDYIGLRKWIRAYPFVHDRSEDIASSLKEIRKRMQALKVDEAKTAEYVEKLDKRIQELIDKAAGGRDPEVTHADIKELESALSMFEKAFLQQYYDKNICMCIRESVEKDVVKMFVRPHGAALSTWDLNVKLREIMETKAREEIALTISKRPKFRLLPEQVEADAVREALVGAAQKGLVALAAGKKKDEIVAEMSDGMGDDVVIWVMKLCDDVNRARDCVSAETVPSIEFAQLLDRLIARQEYLEYLAALDREINYDSQIAMAEDEIAKQLDAEPTETCLKINALLGEYARAMRMLKRGAKLESRLGAAMLVGAVCLDQGAVVDHALELGVPVDATCPLDEERRTALLMAVQLGRAGLVHKLAARGANARAVDARGNSVLHYAARRGNVAVLKAFLRDVDANAANVDGETPIFEAVRVDGAPAVCALVATNANVNAVNAKGVNVMGVACEFGSCTVLDPLSDAGASFGVEQLVIAVTNGQLGATKWLVERGVDVNGKGVMEASVEQPAVRDYLIHQGGLASRFVNVQESEPTNETASVKLDLKVDSAKISIPTIKR